MTPGGQNIELLQLDRAMSIVTYLLIRHFENLKTNQKKKTNTDKTPEQNLLPPQMYPPRALFKERTTIPQPHFLSYSLALQTFSQTNLSFHLMQNMAEDKNTSSSLSNTNLAISTTKSSTTKAKKKETPTGAFLSLSLSLSLSSHQDLVHKCASPLYKFANLRRSPPRTNKREKEDAAVLRLDKELHALEFLCTR
jgi:hypothetical protein